jgi:general secretion pathway protein M
MQQWFNQLKRQEQLLIIALAAVLVLYLMVVLIWRPMSASVSSLRLQNQQSQQSLQQVEQLAAEYKVLEQSAGSRSASKQNLTRLIDNTVKKHQLEMSRFQPSSSGDVQVRFENAGYNNVLAWLNELENSHGVLIKDLSITLGAGSGVVNVSVRMRQGG